MTSLSLDGQKQARFEDMRDAEVALAKLSLEAVWDYKKTPLSVYRQKIENLLRRVNINEWSAQRAYIMDKLNDDIRRKLGMPKLGEQLWDQVNEWCLTEQSIDAKKEKQKSSSTKADKISKNKPCDYCGYTNHDTKHCRRKIAHDEGIQYKGSDSRYMSTTQKPEVQRVIAPQSRQERQRTNNYS